VKQTTSLEDCLALASQERKEVKQDHRLASHKKNIWSIVRSGVQCSFDTSWSEV